MNFISFIFNRIILLITLVFFCFSIQAQKKVFIPSFISNTGMDLNDNNSQWSYKRSIETENLVIFWEPGFGDNPSLSQNPYKIDVQKLIASSEKSFNFYVDSLKFAIKGASVTDEYKLMIFLLYTTDWAAYGSGQDDLVGSLFVNPAAANIEHVVAHEIGHCFQYITGCDSDGGFRYGFGIYGAGGNGFWEQCAQWQGYKVYPQLQFTDNDFNEYIKNNHLHILHEEPRYANYFLPDFWSFKRGFDFMGRLWRESRFPEDPVESYQRINSINQELFNDEIYDHAARLTTWDLPSLIEYGKDYIGKRAQVKMNLVANDFWQIDPSVCIENYGYNSIKLNVPTTETVVKVNFKGIAGETSFRSKNVNLAGWRYGFVALMNDGTRVYSEIGNANYSAGVNPENTLSFICPNNCNKLWLVVAGAPQQHYKHAWDDDNSNDEQWPYQVKFENTNLLGRSSGPIKDLHLTYEVKMEPKSNYDPEIIPLNKALITEAFALTEEDLIDNLGIDIQYFAINPDSTLDSNSTAVDPGHWFDDNGKVTIWGNNSFIYSEMNISEFSMRIGQYPDLCKNGDKFTIHQALVYKRNQSDSARVSLTFNISINDLISNVDSELDNRKILIYPNPTSDKISWKKEMNYKLYDLRSTKLESGKGWSIDLSKYSSGLYMLHLGNGVFKVVKN